MHAVNLKKIENIKEREVSIEDHEEDFLGPPSLVKKTQIHHVALAREEAITEENLDVPDAEEFQNENEFARSDSAVTVTSSHAEHEEEEIQTKNRDFSYLWWLLLLVLLGLCCLCCLLWFLFREKKGPKREVKELVQEEQIMDEYIEVENTIHEYVERWEEMEVKASVVRYMQAGGAAGGSGFGWKKSWSLQNSAVLAINQGHNLLICV